MLEQGGGGDGSGAVGGGGGGEGGVAIGLTEDKVTFVCLDFLGLRILVTAGIDC